MPTARKHAYLALIGNVVIWAAALPITKPALDFVSPNQFLWLRFLVAAAFMLPLLTFLILKQSLSLKTIFKIIPIELLFLVYVAVVYFGLQYTSALEASFILNTRPILITFMGIFLLHETEEVHEWIGFLLSVLGTLVLLFYPLISGQSSITDTNIIGNLIIFFAVCVSTVYAYAVKKTYGNIPKIQVQSVNAVLGFALFSLILFLSGSFPTHSQLSQTSVTTAALYMGLLGTPIALGLLNYGYRLIEASEATLFSYLQPLIYIPLTVLWLGETIYSYQILAMIIIFIGVLIAEYRPGKKGLFSRFHHLLHPHH